MRNKEVTCPTTNQYNFFLSDSIHPMMKHFYPDGRGVFQDDPAHINRLQEITEGFGKCENDMCKSCYGFHSQQISDFGVVC